MKKLRLFFVFMLLAAGFAIKAEDTVTKVLTYDECVKKSLENSFDYKIQFEKLKQANLERLKAIGGLLPVISLEHNRYYNYGSSFDDKGWDSSITAIQPVFHGFSKFFSISEKDRLAAAEAYNLSQTKKNIAEQTAAAFYNLALAQANLLNTQEAVNIITGRTKELQDREALGKSRLSEVYTVQSRQAVLSAQLDQARSDTEAAADALALVMNTDSVMIAQPADSDTTAPEIDSTIAARNQPAIKSIEAELEAQSSRINAQESIFLPQIDLTLTKQIGSKPYTGGNFAFVLAANWPIFDGGARVFDTVSEYSAEEGLKQARLSLLKTTLYDIKSRLRDYNASVSSVKFYKDAYDKSLKSYKMMEKDYRYGMSTNIDVLQALSDLTDVKHSLDTAVIMKEKNRVMLGIITDITKSGDNTK